MQYIIIIAGLKKKALCQNQSKRMIHLLNTHIMQECIFACSWLCPNLEWVVTCGMGGASKASESAGSSLSVVSPSFSVVSLTVSGFTAPDSPPMPATMSAGSCSFGRLPSSVAFALSPCQTAFNHSARKDAHQRWRNTCMLAL